MPRPVAMIAHTYYDEDPRVRREAEALVSAGRGVDVFALRRPGDARRDELRGVRVHRLGARRHQGAPLVVYLAEYLNFFVRAAFAVTAEHARRHFALVQVHTVPDFLVFAALPLKATGVPVVLDLHEVMPEFFRIRFARSAHPALVALVELQERLSVNAADALITVNEDVAARLAHRGVAADKITVVRNSPSIELFDPGAHPRRAFMEDGALRLIYAGALTPNYELHVLLEALAGIRAARPALDVHLDLYGRGDSEGPLRSLAGTLGLDGVVTFHGRIPLEGVGAAIAASDIGISPTQRNHQTELSLPTKVLEYAILGKPVVTSDLPTVMRHFGPGALTTYRAGDADALATALLQLVDTPREASRRAKRAARRVKETAWDQEAPRYVALIERLALDGRWAA